MDDVLLFRNLMAEGGCEYTPDQAAKVMKAYEGFRTRIRKHARQNPEYYQKLADATLQEKQEMRNQLAESGKEVTLVELDQLIDLVLRVYEQEKL